MSICSNCGTKLNAFNESYGLNPDSYLCPKCKAKIDPIFNNDFKPNVSVAWVDENLDLLRAKGITENGIDEFKKYALKHDPEIVKANNEAREKAEKQAQLDAVSMSQFSDTTLNNIAIERLKASGQDGYYEYAVKSLVDEGGRTNLQAMVTLLNEMGLAGWRLVTSHTNELGKNALAIAGFGSNSTADETVLIFERYVKL